MHHIAKLAMLLTALTSASCAPVVECGAHNEPEGTVEGNMCEDMLTNQFTVSSQFSEEQRQGIFASADGWRKATAGRVRVTFTVVDDYRAAIFPSELQPEYGAVFSKNISGILVQPYVTQEQARFFVAHELGHAFGLKHSDDPEDLMYYAAYTDQPSAGDVAAFDRLWQDLK